MAMFEEFVMNSSDGSPEASPPSFPVPLSAPKAKRQPTVRPRKPRPPKDAGVPEIKIPAVTVTKPRSAAAAQPRKRPPPIREQVFIESPYEEQTVLKKKAPTVKDKFLPGALYGDVFQEQPVSKKPRIEKPRAERPRLVDKPPPVEKQPPMAKPRAEKSRVEKPRYEKPWVDHIRIEKPKAEKPKPEKTKVEKPKAEKVRVEKAPRAEKPHTEKIRPEKSKIEKAPIEKAKMEKPRVDPPRMENPRGERPVMEKPFVEKPFVEKLYAGKPRGIKSPVERIYSENHQIEGPALEKLHAEYIKAEKRKAKKASTESARAADYHVEPRLEKPRPEKMYVERAFYGPSVPERPFAEPQVDIYHGKRAVADKVPRKPKIKMPKVAATRVPKIVNVKPVQRQEVFESQEETTDSDRELEASYIEQTRKRDLYSATKRLEDILEVTTGMVDELNREEQDAKRLEEEKEKLLDELLVWEGLADMPQSSSAALIPVENHYVPIRPAPVVENPYSQYVPVMPEEHYYSSYMPAPNSYAPYLPMENPYATYMPIENSYHQYMPTNSSRKPKRPRT